MVTNPHSVHFWCSLLPVRVSHSQEKIEVVEGLIEKQVEAGSLLRVPLLCSHFDRDLVEWPDGKKL
jgi:hypothetical protein